MHVAICLLFRYYDQLVAIENKLPITPSKNSIKFSWKDSFRGWILFNRPQMSRCCVC